MPFCLKTLLSASLCFTVIVSRFSPYLFSRKCLPINIGNVLLFELIELRAQEHKPFQFKLFNLNALNENNLNSKEHKLLLLIIGRLKATQKNCLNVDDETTSIDTPKPRVKGTSRKCCRETVNHNQSRN